MGIWPSTLRHWKDTQASLRAGVDGVGALTAAGAIRGGGGTGLGQPRVFGQWAFVFLVRGSGAYRDVLGKDCEVRAGSWILVFPEIGHSYGPRRGEVWDEFYLCFQGPLFDLWREAGMLSPHRPVGRIRGGEAFWQKMRRLLEPGKSAFSGREALLQWQKLLLDICASPQSKGGEALPDPRLSKACLLIEARAAEADPQWEEVCRQAGLGYENLRVLFRRHLGTTPFRYREKRRIERAVFLARTRKYTARQAAEMLGYYDEAHFSKAFKRATGATFSRFAAGYGAA